MNAIADIQILSRHAFSSRRKVPCPDSSGMTPSPAEQTALERVKSLSYWKGPVSPERVPGGLTNINFRVRKDGESTFVRVGDDIPVHHIMRFNERTASEAAFEAGVSPEVLHAEPGVLIMRFIEGKTCTAEDLRDPARLARVVPLIKRVHRDVPLYLRGPVLAFWVFHVIRDYAHTLERANSKHASRLPELIDIANELELAVGPVDFVFGHNDLLPGNFIDDGDRLWLIDWDYAGYNSPLFDLANLSSNCQFDRDQEDWLLHAYFGRAVDERLQASYRAMKCASLLREAMWSMTSEIFSTLDFDYAAYTADYMDRFARAYATYRTSPA
jgi:thiamine kinase-like enzyme